MTSSNRNFYRSSAASSRSTSPSPPPLFPGMVLPQDPPPYSRRVPHPTEVTMQYPYNTPTGTGRSSSSSNFYSNSNASVRPSTFNAITSTAASLINNVRGTHSNNDGNDIHRSGSPFLRNNLNGINPSQEIPSALVDKHFVYHSSSSSFNSRLRSFRRRFCSRTAVGYFLILALISLFSLIIFQPSIPTWKSRNSVESHYPNNHDRYKYDFDYPLDKSRQQAQEAERRKAWEREHSWRQHGRDNQDNNDKAPEEDEEKKVDSSNQEDKEVKVEIPYGSTPELENNKKETGNSIDTIDPESIVLYRILGNDLPPRHRPGQTLSNVRFILEHEQEFEKTRKFWVLNRIVDQLAEAAIIQLLKHHRQEYIRIPFEEQEYLKQDFRLEDFPEPDFFSSDDYSAFSKVAKLRVLDYTYHDKNRYAMNNNGGRNIVIQHGKTKVDARWIFAFDGNSFMTKNAMNEIKQAIRTYGDAVKYFVVPMARLVDNSQLLKGVDTRPNSKEEPQIIFRNDASDVYNQDMRYGRRSKLELLWRIGALERGKISKPSVSWEPKERDPIPDKADFKTVGWVFRLFSGKKSQEENTRQSAAIRAYNRLLAIQDLIDGIDEKIGRKTFRSNNLLVYKDSTLLANRQKYWIGDSGVTAMVNELQSKADQILSRRVNLLKKASAEDLFIYPGDSQGQPIIPPNSPSVINEDGSSKAITLQGLYDEVTTLTLAHYFTGNETFARAAANVVRTTLLQEHDQQVATHPTTEDAGYLLDHGYSFPALNRLPRIIPKKEGALSSRPLLTIPKDLLKADTLPSFLDAVRMLHRIHVLTQNEYIQLNLVFSTWLEHLVNSPEGILYAKQGDHRASFMDLHVAALAAITDDVRLFLRVVNRCRMRVGRQFLVVQDGKIKMPFESAYATRQSMAGILQPGGPGADVSGHELAGMYLDEENDELDLSLDQSISRPRDLGSMMKETMSSIRKANGNQENQGAASDDEDEYQRKRKPQDPTEELIEDEEYDSLPDTRAQTQAQGQGQAQAQPQAQKQSNSEGATATPPMVPEGSAEPMYTVSELTERYSALNLQYWTLLTRMVGNSEMMSAPDLWRHRSKRGYRLGDVIRNYVRQDHYRSSGMRKATMDALLYISRTNYDHIPPRVLATTEESSNDSRKKTGDRLSKPYNPANEEVLEWGNIGLEANVFEALLRDEQDFKDTVGGSLPGTGVPPFWMLGVVE